MLLACRIVDTQQRDACEHRMQGLSFNVPRAPSEPYIGPRPGKKNAEDKSPCHQKPERGA
jgi:hypothetical protein